MLPRLHVTRCCPCPALAVGACLPPAAAMKPQLLKLMLHAAPALPLLWRGAHPRAVACTEAMATRADAACMLCACAGADLGHTPGRPPSNF